MIPQMLQSLLKPQRKKKSDDAPTSLDEEIRNLPRKARKPKRKKSRRRKTRIRKKSLRRRK